MKPTLQRVVNALGFALLVWYGGPLLAIAEVRPLDTVEARLALLGWLGVASLISGPLRQWWQGRRNAALIDRLQPPGGAHTLAPRFQQALTLLREGIAVSDGPPALRWWRRRQQLLRLPWYLFIGAPGAGKTTALLNSGLRFPLADKLGTAPVRGVAGTRQCDWWFTREAVFIDTAGRYTTQDSDAAADGREWRRFLGLLREHRPHQPLNGVLVTVSVPDLLAGGAELQRQQQAVQARLQELRTTLGLVLPVYLLVTKTDLLAGFTEFFDALDTAQRAQVWGTTLPWGEATGRWTAELQALVTQVHALTPGRLQQETSLARRSPIAHFGAQLDALLPALHGFAEQALVDSEVSPRQPLRGVYLTSGTQEGNPIDRVMGAIARHHGLQAHALPRPDGKGKAFFLTHLLQRVVIAEADLAGTTLARRRRERLAWRTGVAVVAVGLVGLSAAWLVSHDHNRATVTATGQRVQQLAARVASAGPGADWLPLYEVLRDLPRRGEVAEDVVPPGHGFGLYQGARLARTARATYHRVLAATLAPQLAQRLAHELVLAEGDPGLRYQTLKTYLMLLQPERLDRATVRAWAAQSFARGPDAPVNAAQRDEWLRHVDALLERNAFQAVVVPDAAAVRAARQALGAVPLPQRALTRLLREADVGSLSPPPAPETWFGPLYPLLFEAQAGAGGAPPVAVNPLFTQAGYTRHIAPRVEGVLQALADEEDWVLGQGPRRRDQLRTDPAARAALAAEVIRLYATAYAEHWQALLGGRQLVRPADADALARLNAQLAGTDSPLRKLLALARTELRFPAATNDPLATAADAVLAERFTTLRRYADGPGATTLDRLLGEVSRFTLAGGGGLGGGAALARTLQQDAAAAPSPFSGVWSRLAEAVEAAGRAALRNGLAARLEDVSSQCRALTNQRYPFAATAAGNDLGLADFARLFGPDGVLDAFFRRELAPHVDTAGRPWRYRGGEAVADDAVLRSFERAEDIRRTFFAANSPVPRLQFTLRPVEMDEALEEFSLDIDGQTLLYENGPRLARAFTWPGPAGTQRVTLRARGLRGELHEGPWTLLRVLTRQPWTRGEAPADSRVVVALEGRRLVLDLGVRGGGSAAVLAGLSSFRCPQARP